MTEDKILWTARFVGGDLSEAEQAEFEAQLQTDAELQQHLENYHRANSELRLHLAPDADRAALQETLKTLGKQHFAETKVVSLKPFIKWASGIAAVLVLGLFIWAPWRGSLYQQYNTPDQMLVTERGASETELDKAASLYNDGKFAQAQPLLEKLYNEDTRNAQLAYYYGKTLLATQETIKGRQVLTAVYDGESAFKYDAAYAIALSYLKENNKADCKKWLQKIPESTTHYQKVTELIQKL